jgi:hypothetical protein
MRKNLLRWGIGLLAIAALGCVLIFTGCAARTTTVTNLPANVTQTEVQRWDSAVANLDKIAQTVSTLRQLTQALCSATVTTSAGTSPVLATGTCDLLLADIGKIDQAEIAAAGVLQAVPNTWGASTTSQIAQYTQIITAALADITANGLAGIKNPTAVAQVQNFLTTISGAVAIIETL